MPTAGRTLGIDLASQPKNTAVCVVEWADGGGRVLAPPSDPLTDEVLLREIQDERVGRVGVDAPFGWPAQFVEAITAYRRNVSWPGEDPKRLEFRETELRIKALTGKEPLSAVTDQLVWATMRCARLLSALKEQDPGPRSGDGRLVEVYPAGALFKWGLSPAEWVENPGSYKGDEPDRIERRNRLTQLLVAGTEGRLEIGDKKRFVASDDQLDALACALVARAAERNQVESIPTASRSVALAEGWLRLPAEGADLASLV